MSGDGLDPLLRFRPEFPVTGRYIYLNHASIGPLPRRSARRVAALAQVISETGDRRWPERNAEIERVIDRLRPTRAGWRSTRTPYDWTHFDLTFAEGAKRFESGTINGFGIAALGGSLEILHEAGAQQIERRVLELGERSAAGFVAAGLTLAAPRGDAFRGETSGIVSGTHPRRGPDELAEALALRGVVVSSRAGRLRAAPHFYNSEEEVDQFLKILGELVTG